MCSPIIHCYGFVFVGPRSPRAAVRGSVGAPLPVLAVSRLPLLRSCLGSATLSMLLVGSSTAADLLRVRFD